MNEAMPHRLVPVLREFLCEHAGAREVSVLLADYELQELRLLSPGDDEQLICRSTGRVHESPGRW